jgi:uncharacterized protein
VGEMIKLYLIHGWGGSPDNEGWFSWLREECNKRGIELIIPEMPNTDAPKIDEWLGKMKEVVVDLNEDSYFVGHSIGCQAIMRFLELLSDGAKVGGVIFIAGWFDLIEECYQNEEERAIAKPWIEIPIDTEKVKQHSDEFFAIFSTNDDCVPLSDSELFKNKLNAEIIIKEDEGHFNETKEINEIIEFISK